jgi:hypothetical protein
MPQPFGFIISDQSSDARMPANISRPGAGLTVRGSESWTAGGRPSSSVKAP